MMLDYITGLTAPWRRINRLEFIMALTVLSAPGLVMMMLGMMENMGGWIGGAQDMTHSIKTGGVDHLVNSLRGVGVATAAPKAVMDLPALINGLFMLLLYPFVRGRLLDRGLSLRVATILAVVIQLSVLNDVLAALVGAAHGPIPFGMALSALTFIAYIALSFGGSRARKAHDKGPSRHSQLDDDFPPPRF
jgi:hypothetical protein